MVSHEDTGAIDGSLPIDDGASLFQRSKTERATFSLFIRSYPLNRGFFVSAGLHDVLKFLENFALDEPPSIISGRSISLRMIF